MSEMDDGGPAFPRPQAETSIGGNMEQDGMSLREYAAIHLRVPNSGTDWLDDMIREAKRDELAGQALAGYLASFAGLSSVPDGEAAAIKAYAYADAMIAARKGGAE